MLILGIILFIAFVDLFVMFSLKIGKKRIKDINQTKSVEETKKEKLTIFIILLVADIILAAISVTIINTIEHEINCYNSTNSEYCK